MHNGSVLRCVCNIKKIDPKQFQLTTDSGWHMQSDAVKFFGSSAQRTKTRIFTLIR